MGAGASQKPRRLTLVPADEAYNQSHFLKKATNLEARRLQILLSSIGKTTYHEKVLACIKVEFLSTDNLTTHVNGHQTLPVKDCHTIVQEALAECSVPLEDHQPVMERVTNKLPISYGIVDVDDLMYIVGQQMCRYNSFLRARTKFDDLDKDKSGFLDGPELNLVVDWMLKMIEENGVVLSADEVEVRHMMLERIDADKDERLSFEEFLVLFEEEQRKSMIIKYAKQKFNEFDVNRSGVLDGEEITKVVNWLLDLSEEDYEHVDKNAVREQLLSRVGVVGADGDDTIPVSSFMSMCEDEVERLELRRRARDKFRELDKDKSGYLDNDELYKVVDFMYHSLGHREGTRHMAAAKKDLLQRVDANGDGKLDCQEFIDLFEQLFQDANKPLDALVS